MQIPGFLGEFNFITSYFFQSCEAPFQLFIQSNQENTYKTVKMFLDFDLEDVMEGIWKKGGCRPNRHGRKKGKRTGVPEIPELIATRVDIFDDLNIKKYAMDGFALFEVTQAADRLIWNIVLLEMTNTYVYNSLLIAMALPGAYCQAGGRGRIEGEVLDPFNNGAVYSIPLPHVSYMHGDVFADGYRLYVPEGRWTVIGKCLVKARQINLTAGTSVYFTIHQSPDGGTYHFRFDDIPGGTIKDCVFAATFRGPANIELAYGQGHYVDSYLECSLNVFPTFVPAG